jgi:hypothetical protein
MKEVTGRLLNLVSSNKVSSPKLINFLTYFTTKLRKIARLVFIILKFLVIPIAPTNESQEKKYLKSQS